MSLYHEACTILANGDKKGGSLKSRVFNNKNLKNPPAKVYALLAESRKWSSVLKDVIERSQLLAIKKKLSPAIAVLLVHDLLLSKGGIAAPRTHSLRIAVEKHKARLSAELTRCRIRDGFGSIEAFRNRINSHTNGIVEHESGSYSHPRWIRINALRTSFEEQLQKTFELYQQTVSLEDVLRSPSKSKLLYVDQNVPDLVAVPGGHDFSHVEAYLKGEIIIQDKASCFPAYLLCPEACHGDIIDTCAAPGNKTTHLAALLNGATHPGSGRQVFAFERNPQRSQVLKKMVARAGGDRSITVFGNKDFLTVDVNDPQFANVEALLLDPSCSGTGIVGRDDEPEMQLPELVADRSGRLASKKQKRGKKNEGPRSILPDDMTEENQVPVDDKSLNERLRTLSGFQLQLVEHAMRFPQAQRVTYSTCSIHAEENEMVVLRALTSQVAKELGWRLLLREEQPAGLQKWHIRGDLEACESLASTLSNTSAAEVAEGCIRCHKGTIDGTMGFFVASFVRNRGLSAEEEQATFNSKMADVQLGGDDEWTGFSDSEV